MDRQDLPNKLVDCIADINISEVGIDIAEIGLDQLLDDGFLKDLPVIGSFAKMAKTAINIRDYFFIAKVAKFFFSLDSISDYDREGFQRKISDDPDYKRKIGSIILMLLDRFEDLEKPILLAKIFQFYINNNINFNDFRRLSTAIDIAFLDDINELSSESYSDQTLINLIPSGLSQFDVGRKWEASGKVTYHITGLGEMLIRAIAT